jgi:hypothetical protein
MATPPARFPSSSPTQTYAAPTHQGYADRLKPKKKLGGQLGAPEYQEGPEQVAAKATELASWVRRALYKPLLPVY